MRHRVLPPFPAHPLAVALAFSLFLPLAAAQAAGPLLIDHRIARDESGIWNPNIERDSLLAATLGQVGIALCEGDRSRLGDTAWRGIDAELIGAGSTELLKHAFTRSRPSDSSDPNRFFSGQSHLSFPSGEAAEAASLVAPYLFAYAPQQPGLYALALYPLYVGVARVKAQAHWQSDVLAGWAVGALAGWYAMGRDRPLLVQLMPRGIFLGWKMSL